MLDKKERTELLRGDNKMNCYEIKVIKRLQIEARNSEEAIEKALCEGIDIDDIDDVEIISEDDYMADEINDRRRNESIICN